MDILLKTEKINKSFPSGFRLKDCDLTVKYGSCAAILGPNGAGKSTLFQLITGNLDAGSGQIFLKDKRVTSDSFSIKRQFGYLPQNHYFPVWVTGREILNYISSLYALDEAQKRVEQTIEYWDCQDFDRIPLANCSHGMQKRIALGAATIHNPDFLILDEPFSGLDLFHIKALKDLIQDRKRLNKGTILSTHIAPYVAQLCDEVFILKRGELTSLDHWHERDNIERISLIENAFFPNQKNL